LASNQAKNKNNLFLAWLLVSTSGLRKEIKKSQEDHKIKKIFCLFPKQLCLKSSWKLNKKVILNNIQDVKELIAVFLFLDR